MNNEYYLSDTQVATRYSIGRATVWRWVSERKFPNPVKLSPGCTRWRSSDIDAWEKERGAGK